MRTLYKITLIIALFIVTVLVMILINSKNGGFGVLGYLLLAIFFAAAQRIWVYKLGKTDKKLSTVIHSNIVFMVSRLMKQHNNEVEQVNAFLSENPSFLYEVLAPMTGKKNIIRVQLDFQKTAVGNYAAFLESYTAVYGHSKKIEINFLKYDLDKEKDQFYWNFTIYYATE